MITKNCQDCQTPTPYEPIDFDGLDLTSLLPHLCPACTTARNKAAEIAERQARVTSAQEHCRRILPPLMLETDVAHPDYNIKLHNAVRQAYAIDPIANIVIIGPAGCCKSRVFARLCLTAALDGKKAQWCTAHQFALLASRYNDRDSRIREDAQSTLSRFQHAPFLVFDDLGKQEWNKKIEEIFFYLLDERYSHKRPIWFSCNTAPRHMLLDSLLTNDRGPAIIGRIEGGARIFDLTKKPVPH